MTFKPSTWFPIATVLAVVNVGAAWFTLGGLHAMTHAALGLGFGLWAQRLYAAQRERALPDGIEDLELEMNRLRQELGETQERVDFAERMLTQQSERERVPRNPA